jgi:hypothetical protein
MARFKLKQLKIKPAPKVRKRVVVNPTGRKITAVTDDGVTTVGNATFAQLFNSKTGKPIGKPMVLGSKPGKGGPRFTLKAPPVANVSKKADLDAKAKMRERYRNRVGVVLESCLDNLAQLEDFATMQAVTFPNGSVREIPAFTLTAAGEPLGTSGATITRWVKRGMLPEPVLETSRAKVYHIEEVRSFIRIIGKHQTEFKQYRDDHDDVKDSIFEANAGIRKGLFSTK